MIFLSKVVGTKKMTDLLTSFRKIALSQLTGTNLQKELLWMYMNTSEQSNHSISFCLRGLPLGTLLFCQYLHRFCNLINKYNFTKNLFILSEIQNIRFWIWLEVVWIYQRHS